MTQAVREITPWRLFDVEVKRSERLSPSFLRITFAGPDLHVFADNGFDQRFKLVLPLPGLGFEYLAGGADWYQHWRQLPEEQRNPIRTYTVRTVRPDAGEVDVDFALHGDEGPASRWAAEAVPGDRAVFVGPDARYDGDHGGVDFHPPKGTSRLLIAGDETAVPAIAGILDRLPADARGDVLLEVPYAADAIPLRQLDGLRVRWLGRDGGEFGSALIPAVREVAGDFVGGEAVREGEFAEVDVDDGLLWEVPDDVANGPYAWLAGEAGVIKTLRRYLVSDLGVDRKRVAFMGYWRLGLSQH